MQRKASAVWQGDLKTGKGAISTDSGVLKQTQYSFSTRFENGVGTNPEELLAAAHAGCFTMALSAQLGAAGLEGGNAQTGAAHFPGEGAGRRPGKIRYGGEKCGAGLPGVEAVQGRNFGERAARVVAEAFRSFHGT